jgi:hypothetical protein
MGGRAEGLACADPGARTPIGASGNFCSENSGLPKLLRWLPALLALFIHSYIEMLLVSDEGGIR